MKITVSLVERLPDEAVDQFDALMAYCDPRLLSWDVTRAPEGVVAVETSGGAEQEISEKVRRIAARVARSMEVPPAKRRNQVGPAQVRWADDTDEQLEHEKVVQKLGQGAYGLFGKLAALKRLFDEDFRTIALRLGASEASVPSLLELSFLRRIAYFNSFPHYATFASHLRPDIDEIDSFMRRMQQSDCCAVSAEMTDAAGAILSPTVCYQIYNAHCDRDLPAAGVRLTATSACYRWESSNLEHLRRLWEFTMRELVLIGSPQHVSELREKALLATLEYCERLGIQAWVENANDPFFSEDGATKRSYQKGFDMKWELRIPYNSRGQSLAAASFNNMQRTFSERCNITLDGEFAFSGCVGWGLERWVYAFVAQHGLKPGRWPEAIRTRLIGQ